MSGQEIRSVPLGSPGVAWLTISTGEETQHLVTLGEPRDSSRVPSMVEAELSPGLAVSGAELKRSPVALSSGAILPHWKQKEGCIGQVPRLGDPR